MYYNTTTVSNRFIPPSEVRGGRFFRALPVFSMIVSTLSSIIIVYIYIYIYT